MKQEQIQKALKAKQLNYSIVAEALGVTPSHVSNVVNRRFHSKRVAIAVATVIDKPLLEVFPEYETMPCAEKRAKRVSDLKEKLEKVS